MNEECIEFGKRWILESHVKNKRILECGSRNLNGSLRRYVETLRPKQYIGIDLEAGDDVDLILDVGKIVEHFGEGAFDYVICTEMLEHVEDWRNVIINLKTVCKNEGMLLITTRSLGFPFHSFPYDYWRYELQDIQSIFSDFEIIALETDPTKGAPGVFGVLKKPSDYHPTDLSNIRLIFIATGRRTLKFDKDSYQKFLNQYRKSSPRREKEQKINKFIELHFNEKFNRRVKKIYRKFIRKI